MITQLSVFLENAPGRMAAMTRLLGDAGVDLLAVSVADTAGFGIFRAIVNDAKKAEQVLSDGGFNVILTEVIAVPVDNVPGGMARVLEILADGNISVEYLYSFVRKTASHALVLMKVDRSEDASFVLAEHHIQTLSDKEIMKL